MVLTHVYHQVLVSCDVTWLSVSDFKWPLTYSIYSLLFYTWWEQVSIMWSYQRVCHGCHGSCVTTGSIQGNISCSGSVSDPSPDSMYHCKILGSCDLVATPSSLQESSALYDLIYKLMKTLHTSKPHLLAMFQIANDICYTSSSSTRDSGRS